MKFYARRLSLAVFSQMVVDCSYMRANCVIFSKFEEKLAYILSMSAVGFALSDVNMGAFEIVNKNKTGKISPFLEGEK